MPEHEKTTCPRCDSNFECKMGSILICHCSDVKLSEQQQELIAQNWEGCLCHDCLLEISQINDTACLSL